MTAWTARPDADQIVAIISDRDGSVVDYAYNHETAESMVLEGMLAEAVADDGGYWTAERCQRLYDTTAAQYADCWGVS